MARRRWNDLSKRSRRLIVIGGLFETAWKAAALLDLRGRGADEVSGSKKGWAAAIVLVNAAGAVPIAYFLVGRRRRERT